MFVCSCRAVSDRAVRAAIEAGARTIDDLTAKCSAGGRCGGCWPELSKLLAEHEANRQDTDQEQETAAELPSSRRQQPAVATPRPATRLLDRIEPAASAA